MNKVEERAWKVLSQPEQNVLSLSLSHGLSTWEAGEILKIQHYKYLEIKERAEKFFRLFIDYFEAVGSLSLFQGNTVVEPRFRDYIEACIDNRMTKAEACKHTGDSALVVHSINKEVIEKNMLRLKGSPHLADRHLHMLILEFDRWNNKRILPRSLQMPSAYRRRLNKRDKAYIHHLNRIKTKRVENMLSFFSYNPRRNTSKHYYVALISEKLFDNGYQVIKVKSDNDTLEKLNKLYIYAFTKESHADVFGYLVTSYGDKVNKSGEGQRFWPNYRDMVGKAVNFNEVSNIPFYVEDLEKAYKNNKHVLKRRKVSKTGAVKKANSNNFY